MTSNEERVLGILLGVGMKRSTITYTALAERIGLNLAWSNHRGQLGVMLGAVADYTSTEWGILIPAIAVGKGDNMPSGRTDVANPSGFYAWCAHKGIDISSPHKLVINEQRKVYNLLSALMSTFGYVSYNPSLENASWIARTAQILVEYQDELPLTVRQVFYRLVASYDFDKTEKAYSRLATMLTRARRASALPEDKRGSTPYIPFAAIRDDKLRSAQGLYYNDTEDFRDSILQDAANYRLDRQVGQPQYIELWCEAQGMLPVLNGIADPYSMRVSSSGGYDSITTKHNLALRVAHRANEEQLPTLLLHVGDFDGSGEDMFHNIRDDVGMMVAQFCKGNSDWLRCERVALTADQVIERNVITAPPKPSDSRTVRFVERHWEVVDWAGSNDISAQLEALTPTDLRALFTDMIESHLDRDAYEAQLATERTQREPLVEKLQDLDLNI